MIDDPAAREHVARVWGVDAGEPARQGTVGVRAARRARHRRRRPGAAGLRQQHRGLRAQRDARRASGWTSLDLLVVADIVMSETAAMADVVLPVTQWAEETGTMTNLEGRVILRERAVAPPGRACAATSTCSPGWPSGSARRCRSAPTRRRSSPSSAPPRPAAGPTTPASTTTGSAREHGVFWPCPTADHPGTPRHVRRLLRHPGRPRPVRRRRARRAPPSSRATTTRCT